MPTSWRESNRLRWVGVRPAHEGTQVVGRGGGENSEVICYTVPAGYVFFLCGIIPTFSTSTSGRYGEVRVYSDVPALAYRLFGILAYGLTEVCAPMSYYPPLELPAGYTLRTFSSGLASECYCAYNGWIEPG